MAGLEQEEEEATHEKYLLGSKEITAAVSA